MLGVVSHYVASYPQAIMKKIRYYFLFMKHFTFYLFLLLSVTACHAPRSNNDRQDTAKKIVSLIDSTASPQQMLEHYKQAFEEADNDMDRLEALYEGSYYATYVPEERDGIYELLEQYAAIVPDCELKAMGYIILGTYPLGKDMTQTLEFFQTAMELIPKFPENGDVMKAYAYALMSWLCYEKGDFEQAQNYVFEALPVLEVHQNKRIQLQHTNVTIDINVSLAQAYIHAAAVFRIFSQDEKSSEYIKKMFALKETIDRPSTLASIYISYAIDLMSDKPDEASEYIQKAYKIGMEHGLVQTVTAALDNLSWYEETKENIPAAIDYLEQELAYLKDKNRPDIELNAYHNLGCLYWLQEDYKKMEELALRCIAIADSTQSKLYITQFHKMLANAYDGQKMYDKAYPEALQFFERWEEIKNEQSQQQINYLNARYDANRREMKIEQQQHVIARQNMQRGLLAGGIAVCVVFLALLWYMLRLRNRRNVALTERNDALTERSIALSERNDALTERNVALTERADILSEMNATKDKFFNIISHDLKNPALALHDNLRLLVRHVRQWDADMLSDFSNELLHSAEGQVELLNSLLNWARIQTGRITYAPVDFDLAARLRTDISLVHKLAENKGITFDCQMPHDAIVHGDSNMLLTVVRNLLTNAIKFTAPGGTVTLSITADLSDSDSSDISDVTIHHSLKYIVSVTDTGTGMTPEQIENLFRLDKPQTHRGTAGEEGTGLGLIVCKELLGMHDAVLHVESEQGKGSRFWFTL